MARIIFDTDILINIGRGDAEAIECFRTHTAKSSPAISVITQMELIVGCRDKAELQQLKKFLTRFQVLQITSQTSSKAAKLLERFRLSHGLLIPDALIAATARDADEDFITKNQKDFRFIDDLKLLSYP